MPATVAVDAMSVALGVDDECYAGDSCCGTVEKARL